MSMLSLCDGWWMRVYPLGFIISLHLVLVSLFHFDILYFHGKRRQPIYCFFRFFVHLFNEHNSQWETRIEIMRKFNVIVSRPRLSFPNCRYLNGTPDNILNRTITLIALCVCVARGGPFHFQAFNKMYITSKERERQRDPCDNIVIMIDRR